MKAILRISAILVFAGAVANTWAEPAASVYKAKCAACHGPVGDASSPAGKALKVPSFSSDAVMKESDADMLTVTKAGKGKMPAWQGKLSDDQLKELIAYIHTLQKK